MSAIYPPEHQQSPPQPPPEQLEPEQKPRKRWPRRAAIGVGLAVVLIAGVAIGAAAHSTGVSETAYKAEQAQVSSLQNQVSSLKTQVATDNTAVATARTTAATAQQTANANAAAAYKAREASLAQTYQGKEAALQAQENTLASEQATLKQELGQVQANSISASGVYVVGQDIKSGTWHTNGDGGNNGGISNACYFATLNSTNTSDIADNNNFDGAESADLSGVYAFEISGPCTWNLVP